jgi:phosphoesterase RecJ-like protein
VYKKIEVPLELLNFIREADKFLIAGHKEPDGDCIGSQLALSSVLRRLGKQAQPCSAGPFIRTEVMRWADLFCLAPKEDERKGARVIVVDCSDIDRTGDLAPGLEGLPIAYIDHHASGSLESSGRISPVYLDPAAPSVTYMIFNLIEALGMEPTAEETELLFFGLCTDTGFFRHVDEKGAAVFECAARMVERGANPKKTYHAMYGGKTLNSRILLGKMLSRVESYFDGRLLVTTEELEESERYGKEGRDTESLYQLLQSVAGIEAVGVIRQETRENCTVSFRSLDRIDVGSIAVSMGGGGHRNASGLSIKGDIPEIRRRILEAFEKVF